MKKFLSLAIIILIFAGCSQGQNDKTQLEPDIVVIPPDTAVPTNPSEPTIAPTEEPTNTPAPQPTFSAELITIGSGEPIKLAYLLFLSDPLGVDQVRGVEIAISDFGAEIQGHSIELTGLNSECNEFAGQQGALKLMEDEQILGIIGTTCSIPGFKAAQVVSENNRVMISPSNSNPDLTAPDIHSLGYARTAPNDLVQIKAVAQFSYESLGSRKMAIIRGETDRFSRLYSTTLCEFFAELGGECILDIPKYDGSTYVTPIIISLIEDEADSIYFMGWSFEEGAAFLTAANAAEELNDVPVILWGEIYNDPGFLEEAGDEAIGAYISATSYDYDTGSSQYQEFLAIYQENYGEAPPRIYHPYAYDAATLLLKAISEVAVLGDDGSLQIDPLAVREAMYYSVEFQGLSGYISCSPLGDCLSTASGKVYEFVSGDPATFNPGPADLLSSNPAQIWP